MSLITRCPACGTMFKVVPDQLRISEGWVRCGHCSEVFDAAANMQVEEAAPMEPTPPVPHALADLPESISGESIPPHEEEFGSSLTTEVGDSLASEPPDSTQLEAEARALAETPLDRPFSLMRADTSDAVEAPPPAEARPRPEPEPELHEIPFVRQARREEFWRSPGMRVLLALAALALAALLVAQVAIHDRDRIAAIEPALRPWLARLCEPLACRVGPPRQIDTLSIDSSSFNKLRGDAYRLNFTLKNQAPTEVAMPSLELTLTDGQDQPVVRRVLTPAEFTNRPPVLQAASEWSGSVALAVNTATLGERIAGYRLLAFYP
ncbi:DUF3426 domain-containing protein [Caenimonas aquaedulcis]|uniref:Zinc-ribbon domain-containing protein n=1 Tax=Caenimonas aquaedulcis TaxID=2793270 RepID=A0A931H7R7_9BURK|nr:DUF3426 domain-containing protein [Caenimonas aquaedulcis]MBG9389962.1 zinc-ribbon domain-containing protein [Caenimonas aquaedulcis]